MTSRQIELHTAYLFDCEDCGAENLVRAVVHEFSPDDAKDMREQIGVEGVTGDFVTVPELVKCNKCGAEFKPTGSGAEEA